MNGTEHHLLGHLLFHADYIGDCLGRQRAIAVGQFADLPADIYDKAWERRSYRLDVIREDVVGLSNRLFQLERLAAEFFPALRPELDALEVECVRLANGCDLAATEMRIPSISWGVPKAAE
jgi:hypothetical protein